MSEIKEPEFSPNIRHAIMAHVGEEDWHDKSQRRVMFSRICSDTEHFLPANDVSTEAPDDFVGRIKEAFKEYGTFPTYNISNLWVSFRVFPKMEDRKRRIRLYIGGAHYHVYRILVPNDEAIRALKEFVKHYLEFEKEWWETYDDFVYRKRKFEETFQFRISELVAYVCLLKYAKQFPDSSRETKSLRQKIRRIVYCMMEQNINLRNLTIEDDVRIRLTAMQKILAKHKIYDSETKYSLGLLLLDENGYPEIAKDWFKAKNDEINEDIKSLIGIIIEDKQAFLDDWMKKI